MAAAEITRAETSQRARLLRVRSYDVALDLTRGEEVFGSVAYACFDQPDLKAEFTFGVTAPAHWTVLSNMPAAQAAEPAGEGRAAWRFLPCARAHCQGPALDRVHSRGSLFPR